MQKPPHLPVMANEVLAAINPASTGSYVDATLGAGGHAALILEASSPGGRLLGLDRDPRALELAGQRLAAFGDRAVLARSSFDLLGRRLADFAPHGAQGILLDLGVSSMQFDEAGRGFSFRRDEPLDMRMSPEGITAAELLDQSPERELAAIIRDLGEEPFAGRIARLLVETRGQVPITTTGQLAELVEKAIPFKAKRKMKLNPATKTFMALRLAVNDELGRLERFLEQVPDWLAPGGVLAVLSYHSLEDRRVKKALAAYDDPCQCPPEFPVCTCGKKPIFKLAGKKGRPPSLQEIEENPRARSAKLRVATRTSEARA